MEHVIYTQNTRLMDVLEKVESAVFEYARIKLVASFDILLKNITTRRYVYPDAHIMNILFVKNEDGDINEFLTNLRKVWKKLPEHTHLYYFEKIENKYILISKHKVNLYSDCIQ